MMTAEHLPAEMYGLLPEIAAFTPPAIVFDKRAYSPWIDGRLNAFLRGQDVETLVITGGDRSRLSRHHPAGCRLQRR